MTYPAWTKFGNKEGRCGLALLLAAVFAVFTAHAQVQFHPHQIFGDPDLAHNQVRDAIAQAEREHKRVILDFGGNWCGDCQVLDYYFHLEPNAALLRDNFVMVDVNIGHFDENVDLADRYQVPLKRGVPALAVLDSHGRLLYSQKSGEFEAMRRMQSSSVTDFLTRWKPTR
ncbi:thioredoxin family protein [Paracidobacterium acidisoli]|uniref:Thioredoxin family protein n=1 Tax=Paracidobacterium acidisoli TaxID=2303751 RepID=A0A372INF9_9BACT|nr:thioredoxin family protein [Paracidobacterium acidisoli]MBT9332162.1 thioredoxin family protein [Paracidobacterium acidisoli]